MIAVPPNLSHRLFVDLKRRAGHSAADSATIAAASTLGDR